MTTNRVIHFELHATDPETSLTFFENVFGWNSARWEGPEDYWLLTTGDSDSPGINGAVMRSRDGQPRTVNTILVDSIDVYCRRVAEQGGQVVVPKSAVPGVGYVAYCTDPSGVLFGLFQDDMGAA